MAKQILCPYCSKSFPADKALYQCTNTDRFNGEEKCPSVVDPILNNHWMEEGVPTKRVFSGRVFPVFGKKIVLGAKCPTCHQLTKRVVCPECHNPLPNEMVEDGSTVISIIGDRSSGKTVYFLSLIQQLQKYGYTLGLYEANPLDLAHDDKTRASTVYTRMSSKMFDDYILPDQTRALRPAPMIFRLSFKGQEKKFDKSIFLVFYDTAGEIFQNAERINDTARYLKDSAGVIFLIDPFTMEGLRDTLVQGGIIETAEESFVRSNPSRIFNSLMQINGKELLKNKPLALTYSKIDAVVKALENSPQGYTIPGVNLRNNSSFIKTGKFDLGEIEMIHEGLKTVSAEKWDAGRFWGAASGAYEEGNVRMFAMSALGNNPDAMGKIKKPTPYRVMDPLVWILYKIGFAIPTV